MGLGAVGLRLRDLCRLDTGKVRLGFGLPDFGRFVQFCALCEFTGD